MKFIKITIEKESLPFWDDRNQYLLDTSHLVSTIKAFAEVNITDRPLEFYILASAIEYRLK